jgi:hypothetical protein
MQKRSKRAGRTNDEQKVISSKDSGKGIQLYYIFRGTYNGAREDLDVIEIPREWGIHIVT